MYGNHTLIYHKAFHRSKYIYDILLLFIAFISETEYNSNAVNCTIEMIAEIMTMSE